MSKNSRSTSRLRRSATAKNTASCTSAARPPRRAGPSRGTPGRRPSRPGRGRDVAAAHSAADSFDFGSIARFATSANSTRSTAVVNRRSATTFASGADVQRPPQPVEQAYRADRTRPLGPAPAPDQLGGIGSRRFASPRCGGSTPPAAAPRPDPADPRGPGSSAPAASSCRRSRRLCASATYRTTEPSPFRRCVDRKYMPTSRAGTTTVIKRDTASRVPTQIRVSRQSATRLPAQTPIRRPAYAH